MTTGWPGTRPAARRTTRTSTLPSGEPGAGRSAAPRGAGPAPGDRATDGTYDTGREGQACLSGLSLSEVAVGRVLPLDPEEEWIDAANGIEQERPFVVAQRAVVHGGCHRHLEQALVPRRDRGDDREI